MNTIPKRFIRIWLGKNIRPDVADVWWNQFKDLHKNYEFITLTDNHQISIPDKIKPIYYNAASYAGQSDILRLLALDQIGGIYIDTDMMPLKSFDHLTKLDQPFIGQRSSVSFATGVIGCPKGHKAINELINFLPVWYKEHQNRSCSVSTGPAFVSKCWFGRRDVSHLPIKTFYPYNGFMQPSLQERLQMFANKKNFPPEMLAAHFGNHKWGGKPNKNVVKPLKSNTYFGKKLVDSLTV